MTALRTTYHAPTATKGPRITAVDAYGSKCTSTCDSLARNPLDPLAASWHRRAAEALCNKLGLKGQLYGGDLSDGMAWVLVPEEEPKVPTQHARADKPETRTKDHLSALWCISQILHMLPARRDWLDPDIEKIAKELTK